MPDVAQPLLDEVLPRGRWQFDAEVTTVFDDMLARSIPQYDVMRRTVFELACEFARPGGVIVDLGCSRGEALALLVERFGDYNRYVGVDVSEPMLNAAGERFRKWIDRDVVSIRRCDLRCDYPPERAAVTLCVLTLQFTPIEYRQQIMRRIWEHTLAGGALILVEKVLGSNADMDGLMNRCYYALKSSNGYSQEQIERKRLSLEGVLVPVTARWNEELLHAAGFAQVECFWRWMNFAGWIALRG